MSSVVELTPTRRMLIPRMPGRGDLLIEVTGEKVLLRADHVERLAGIPTWLPGETLIDDHWEWIGEHPAYAVDVARARCEEADTAAAAVFLAWLDEQLAALLQDEALDMAQRVPSFVDALPVSTAARDLTTSTGVSIGRDGLFGLMHTLGWLDRAGGEWAITAPARRDGWLTTRVVNVPSGTKGRGRPYAQVHVTPAGLAELTRTLLARTADPPPPDPHPALFD